MWYTDFTEIPGEPTLNKEEFRTFNVKVHSGPDDYSRKNPWRAPGTAPVAGSGCGLLGGALKPYLPSAGHLLPNHPNGTDGAVVAASAATEWPKGSVQEVAWAITANHGGGYSYRLCPKSANITEECFQRHVLRFANDKHLIRYGKLALMGQTVETPDYEVPMVKLTQGTHPEGSEWARNPIPSCKMFDQTKCKGLPKEEFVACAQAASGYTMVQCPPGMTQFPEPLSGISGHVPSFMSKFPELPQWSNEVAGMGGPSMGFPFSIVDQVVIPEGLAEGEYLLSWRWDCEQSSQVWQNCADINVVGKGAAGKSEESRVAKSGIILP